MVLDSEGNARIVWKHHYKEQYYICYTDNVSGDFCEPIVISDTAKHSDYSKIDVFSDDEVGIIWIGYDGENYTIYFVKSQGDTFGEVEILQSEDHISELVFNIYNDVAQIVYRTHHHIYYIDNLGGNFCSPILVDSSDCSKQRLNLVNHFGKVYILWYEPGRIRYAIGTRGGFTLYTLASIESVSYLVAKANPSGKIWAAWKENKGDSIHIYVSEDMGTPQKVSQDTWKKYHSPAIDVNKEGEVGIFWQAYNAYNKRGALLFGIINPYGNEAKFNKNSRTLEFETPPVVGSKIVVEGYLELLPISEAYCFPNPATTGEVKFRCYVREYSKITIDIFDIAFDRVARFETFGIGTIVTKWDVGDVAPGIYIYRINASDMSGHSESVEKKIIIR